MFFWLPRVQSAPRDPRALAVGRDNAASLFQGIFINRSDRPRIGAVERGIRSPEQSLAIRMQKSGIGLHLEQGGSPSLMCLFVIRIRMDPLRSSFRTGHTFLR